MQTSFIIYHVESTEKGLVKTIPNAEQGDLVFITGVAEEDAGSLGVLLECVDSREHLWTTRPLPIEDLVGELMSRLQHRFSGEDAPKMFDPILNAKQEPREGHS